MSKKIQLSIVAIIAIVIFFQLPVNKAWLDDVILVDVSLIPAQLDYMDEEYRNQARYKESYQLEMAIKGFFDQTPSVKPLLLLPPTGYFKAKGLNFPIPEPAIFYYFTGIRSVWTNSKMIDSANWVVIPADNQMYIFPIQNRHQLDSFLTIFKPYPPTL